MFSSLGIGEQAFKKITVDSVERLRVFLGNRILVSPKQR